MIDLGINIPLGDWIGGESDADKANRRNNEQLLEHYRDQFAHQQSQDALSEVWRNRQWDDYLNERDNQYTRIARDAEQLGVSPLAMMGSPGATMPHISLPSGQSPSLPNLHSFRNRANFTASADLGNVTEAMQTDLLKEKITYQKLVNANAAADLFDNGILGTGQKLSAAQSGLPNDVASELVKEGTDKLSHSFGDLKIDPKNSDAETLEQRYGELAIIFGLLNLFQDTNYSFLDDWKKINQSTIRAMDRPLDNREPYWKKALIKLKEQ